MDPDKTSLMSIDCDSQCSQVASNSDCGGKTFFNQLDGPGLGDFEQLCRGVKALNLASDTKVQCVEEATCIPICTRSRRPKLKVKRWPRKPKCIKKHKPKPKCPCKKKKKSCRPKKKMPKYVYC